MRERWIKVYLTFFLLGLAALVPKEFVIAQDINLRLEPSASLENTQILSLNSLGIENENSGRVLISAFLENMTAKTVDNLYLEVNVNAARIGTIAELKSHADKPFTLAPNQSVYATNNVINNGRIPGIRESISFSGGLTPEGEELISNLSGSMSLPSDVYSIEVIVFRVTDATGRQDLARSMVEIGARGIGASFSDSEIYLKAPGDIVGSGTEITNPYPQFSWEGPNNVAYRLLVVEDNGQDSPESLLQSAQSSPETKREGGSLLEFENLDVLVNRTSYQYPSSGAQALEQGKTYYWKVITSLRSNNDLEEISSEIWSFTLSGASGALDGVPNAQRYARAIVELIGQDAYRELKSNGFELTAIEYDGQELTGLAAAEKLEEILQKIRDEEIILGGN